MGNWPGYGQVIGGLCWCILGSGAEVDADIFYDEDLALGQKMCVLEIVPWVVVSQCVFLLAWIHRIVLLLLSAVALART